MVTHMQYTAFIQRRNIFNKPRYKHTILSNRQSMHANWTRFTYYLILDVHHILYCVALTIRIKLYEQYGRFD